MVARLIADKRHSRRACREGSRRDPRRKLTTMTETVAGSPVWKPAPHRVPAPGLPTSVRIYEVGATRRTSSGNSGDPDRDESPVHRTPGRSRLPHCRIDEFRLTSMDPATCGRGRIDGSAAPAGLGTYGRSCPEPQGSRAGRRRRSEAEVAVFVSATKEFAKRNLNSTVDGAIAAAAEVTTAARALGLPVPRLHVPCASATPGKAPCPSSVSPTSQRP